MNQDYYNRVLECICRACEGIPEKINPNSLLQEDLGMESLQLVLLQVELENEFGFTFDPIDDNFFEIFKSISSVCDFVIRKTQ